MIKLIFDTTDLPSRDFFEFEIPTTNGQQNGDSETKSFSGIHLKFLIIRNK